MKGSQAQGKNGPEQTLKDADLNRVASIEKSYKFFKKVADPRLSEVSIVQDPATRNFLAAREVRVNARNDAVKLVLWARKRVGIKHPALLNLVDYSVTKQSELCSSFYIVKLFFEYPKTDMKKEILERQRAGEYFADTQLIDLLYQGTQACNAFAAADVAGHNLEPLLFGLNKETGAYKLIAALEEPSTAARFKQVQKNRLVSGAPLYQSPLVYSNLKKGNLNFEPNLLKEDAFALGLIILEAGNLGSIQDIYNSGSGEMNHSVLQQHIGNFQNRYGGPNAILPKAISVLLAADEAMRPTLRELEAKMPEYEQVRSSIANIQRSGQYTQPVVLDTRGKQPVMVKAADPSLYDTNGINYNDVKPSLSPNAYSRYLQDNAEPTPEYGYIPPNPQPSIYGERMVVNKADFDNGTDNNFQPNGRNSYYAGQNEVAYRPSNFTHATFSQPYTQQVQVSHQYTVETPVEHVVRRSYRAEAEVINHPSMTYTTYENVHGGTRYVQNAPTYLQENVMSSQSHQESVELSGLKLVGTYMDTTNATDQPNY